VAAVRSGRVYDERAVVRAYLDAQRPAYPHEDLRRFRRGRLDALEKVYEIRLSADGLSTSQQVVLWMLFSSAAESALSLRGPREGFLDDSLLNVTIERLGDAGTELLESESDVRQRVGELRGAYESLLVRLFVSIWGPIAAPVTSAELRRVGFDDEAEPRITDYFDEM
jgi:hypothetical protein